MAKRRREPRPVSPRAPGEPELPDHKKEWYGAVEERQRRGETDGPAVYRNECGKCGGKINYAFARRAQIPGICGKCHDAIRKAIRREVSAEVLGGTAPKSNANVVHFIPRRVYGRALLVGALLGFAAAIGLFLVRPSAFEACAAGVRSSLGELGRWAAMLFHKVGSLI